MSEKTINVNAGIDIVPMVAAQLTNAYFSALSLQVRPGQIATEADAKNAHMEVMAKWREFFKMISVGRGSAPGQ